jgi:hypothetical protein
MKNGKDGYEGLIEAALAISALFRVDQQWDTVASALQRAFPSYILTMASIYIYTHTLDFNIYTCCLRAKLLQNKIIKINKTLSSRKEKRKKEKKESLHIKVGPGVL